MAWITEQLIVWEEGRKRWRKRKLRKWRSFRDTSKNKKDEEDKKEERLSSQSTQKNHNIIVAINRVFAVISDSNFLSCKIVAQFAGSRLHLCSCWFIVTYCPSVEKQVTRQFKYYWLIDWILLLGVHVVMKGQSFVVFRILTLAVHVTVLFSHYHFSVCYHEALNLRWIYVVCY